jgi:hypothetical protein
MMSCFTLPAECTIAHAGHLKHELGSTEATTVNASGTVQLSTPALQLLYSWLQADPGRHLVSPSQAFLDAAKLTGLEFECDAGETHE